MTPIVVYARGDDGLQGPRDRGRTHQARQGADGVLKISPPLDWSVLAMTAKSSFTRQAYRDLSKGVVVVLSGGLADWMNPTDVIDRMNEYVDDVNVLSRAIEPALK